VGEAKTAEKRANAVRTGEDFILEMWEVEDESNGD